MYSKDEKGHRIRFVCAECYNSSWHRLMNMENHIEWEMGVEYDDFVMTKTVWIANHDDEWVTYFTKK